MRHRTFLYLLSKSGARVGSSLHISHTSGDGGPTQKKWNYTVNRTESPFKTAGICESLVKFTENYHYALTLPFNLILGSYIRTMQESDVYCAARPNSWITCYELNDSSATGGTMVGTTDGKRCQRYSASAVSSQENAACLVAGHRLQFRNIRSLRG